MQNSFATSFQNDDAVSTVEYLLHQAITSSASDIHIEPCKTHYRIRYRQDGLLYETMTLPHETAHRLITRLKVLAKLDIAERRFPQDGRFQQESLDVRLSVCPTLFGEKLVLRLLNPHKNLIDLDALGMTIPQKKNF